MSRRSHETLRRHRVAPSHPHDLLLVVAMLLALPSLFLGCAPHLYKQWDTHLKQMVDDGSVGRPYRLDDVSLLLGGPPDRCEKLDSPHPKIGIVPDDKMVLRAVVPGGPAQEAGLRVGMTLISVEGNKFSNQAELLSWCERTLREDTAVKVETDQGTFSVVPRTPILEQCYWAVSGGHVERAGAGGSWTRSGGGAWGHGAAYDRYYRATCRFQDGLLITFTSNWQM